MKVEESRDREREGGGGTFQPCDATDTNKTKQTHNIVIFCVVIVRPFFAVDRPIQSGWHV